MGISPLSTYSSLITAANNLTGPSANSKSSANSAASLFAQDTQQLSGPAQLYQQLQSLSQTNPNEFKQLTAQISSTLQQEATQAQAGGDTTEAQGLTQLASQFQTASQTGQLTDPEQTSGTTSGTKAHHHGHHHHGGGDSSSSTSDSSSSSSSSTSNDILSALQSASSNSLSLLASLAPITSASTATS